MAGEWAGVTTSKGSSVYAGVGLNRQTANRTGMFKSAFAKTRAGDTGSKDAFYKPAEPNDLDSWINLRGAYDQKLGTTINGGSSTNSRSVSVQAPVSVHVARADQAPGATAKAVSAAVQKGSTATASRFQASPSEVA
jgi:hypothetical protein